MTIRRLDHVAVPVDQMEPMVEFYASLGFVVDESLAPLLVSVSAGDMKINLHDRSLWESGAFDLRGPTAVPGCLDICVVWDGDGTDLDELLTDASIEMIEGPVERDGGRDCGTATGASRYVRDPDGNLVEFIIYA
ncbi:MAG: hypothetical protein AAGD33_18690 [Actinomycetota bacterium]